MTRSGEKGQDGDFVLRDGEVARREEGVAALLGHLLNCAFRVGGFV